MNKSQRAREYGHKAAERWEVVNTDEAQRYGHKPFTLEWMLSHAWKMGFEAGQRHQIKAQKEKNKDMK